MTKNMSSKILKILGSVRFWIIVLTAVLAVLNGQPVIETVQVALAAVVALGTVDSAALRLSGKK